MSRTWPGFGGAPAIVSGGQIGLQEPAMKEEFEENGAWDEAGMNVFSSRATFNLGPLTAKAQCPRTHIFFPPCPSWFSKGFTKNL